MVFVLVDLHQTLGFVLEHEVRNVVVGDPVAACKEKWPDRDFAVISQSQHVKNVWRVRSSGSRSAEILVIGRE